MQLSRLGRYVQARRGRTLRHRRKAGPTARPTLPVARRGRKGAHRRGRTGASPGQKGSGRKEGSRRRRPFRSLWIGHGSGREPRKAKAPEDASRQDGPGSARWKGQDPRTGRCQQAPETVKCLRGIPWLEKEMMPCCVPGWTGRTSRDCYAPEKRRKHFPLPHSKTGRAFSTLEGICAEHLLYTRLNRTLPRASMFLTMVNTSVRNNSRRRSIDSARSLKPEFRS